MEFLQDNNGGFGGGGGDDDDHGGGPRRKTNKNTKRAAPYNNTQPKAKRKCGKCGEEGHNRTKCPN